MKYEFFTQILHHNTVSASTQDEFSTKQQPVISLHSPSTWSALPHNISLSHFQIHFLSRENIYIIFTRAEDCRVFIICCCGIANWSSNLFLMHEQYSSPLNIFHFASEAAGGNIRSPNGRQTASVRAKSESHLNIERALVQFASSATSSGLRMPLPLLSALPWFLRHATPNDGMNKFWYQKLRYKMHISKVMALWCCRCLSGKF